MKKLFLALFTSIGSLSLCAQVPLEWTTTTPTRFTINNPNSAISANGTTSFSHYANSTQKLGTSKNGYIEFTVLAPGPTGYYDVGFASSSSPNSLVVGFHLIDGGGGSTIYIGANGSAFGTFGGAANIYTGCFCYYYESGSPASTCSVGDRLRIERINNVIHFWNVTANTELFYLTPSATAFTVSPTSDWTAFFGNASPTTPVSGVTAAISSFSGLGLNGDDNLWIRTSSNAIRPASLSDKVGVGKDPTVELDVQGKAKISTLSGTGTAIVEANSTGELVRKRMSTTDSVLAGDGTWVPKPISKWQYATSPSGSIYFQPAANPYVGINLNAPAANLDIFNATCDNLPALKITNDEWGTCLMPFVNGDYIDCKATIMGGGTAQRFIVKENGWVGINRTPSYSMDAAGNIRANATVYTSDSRFKKNVQGIDQPLDLLKKLSGKTYQFRTEEFPAWHFDEGKQYGFIAQELKQIMPELVSEDKDGYLGVNYVMLIPVLTEAIKTQQLHIEQLEKEIRELKSSKGSATGIAEDQAGKTDHGFLAQNVPNPFSAATEIKYQLPAGTQRAFIGVYDLNGKEIRQFSLGSAQNGSVTIQGGDLPAGMYLYTLVVDGKAFDTKRMVLTAQ